MVVPRINVTVALFQEIMMRLGGRGIYWLIWGRNRDLYGIILLKNVTCTFRTRLPPPKAGSRYLPTLILNITNLKWFKWIVQYYLSC